MNANTITVPGRTASTIAAEIRVLQDQAKRMALMYIIEIGKRLTEAKELVPYGEWGEYLEAELGYKQSSANNYMKIYREYGSAPEIADSQALGNLSYTQALELLALPSGEREEFVQQHDVENMSSRELKQAIRDRDAAQKAQAEAQQQIDDLSAKLNEAQHAAESQAAEIRNTRQELLDMQQRAASAKSSESAWQEEIDKLKVDLAKASAAATKAKEQLKKQKENPVISDEVREKLTAAAAADAAQKVRDELAEKLAAAEEATQAATLEKEAAERAAKEAADRLAVADKATIASRPEVATFKVTFDIIQENVNRIMGLRNKVREKDPEMAEKMNTAIRALAESLRKKADSL